MRKKMRTLTLFVKADFVKQDKGVSTPIGQPKTTDQRASSSDATPSTVDRPAVERFHSEGTALDGQDDESGTPPKRPRPRSKTFTFSKRDTSPTKKQKSDSRPNSVYLEDPSAIKPNNSSTVNVAASPARKSHKAAVPNDFVDYLREVRDPVQAEVGRLHKLRLLLRNETVSWVDSFISLGGMTEIVDLLHRIMAIEWREEHEDQLLHETLLCLKGLCTTEVALKKLDEMADTLFPSLLAMLFDEEKKGPSEFSTRGVIVNVLCKLCYSKSVSDTY